VLSRVNQKMDGWMEWRKNETVISATMELQRYTLDLPITDALLATREQGRAGSLPARTYIAPKKDDPKA
jgi:hypothetical protein